MRTRPLLTTLSAIVLAVVGMAAAPTDRVALATAPAGAVWTEAWIDTPDGERLHADVLRPESASDADRTPVILVVSPYLGMTELQEQPGPSNRFFDFYEGADVFARGYSVVQVSLRGTGGSSGCLDILGPGEQTDVVTAVAWAASQPWSTGKVGMYGKSYDANTGALAAALRPEGLAAVVAQQIAPDRYRGSYNDRVRLLQSLAYPSYTYGTQGEGGFSLENEPEYIANSVTHSADCQALLAEHYLDDESSEFWTVRDFVDRAEGSAVPTFITTGYLDAATNIGAGAVDLFNALEGDKRLWIGWWGHVRGNDVADGRPAMGREGFFDEVMRFLDHHVKGVPLGQAPTHLDPVIAAQGSDGTWRKEAAWPPADARGVTAPLLAGSYVDDASNAGSRDSDAGPGGLSSGSSFGEGAWTISPPLPHRAHLGGIPTATVELGSAVPRTNVVVNVYDIAPDGSATMLTRGAALADGAGAVDVLLWPTDWLIEPGHRVGVLVSGANVEAWVHVPTNTTVDVAGGSIDLPFLERERVSDLDGDIAHRLVQYRVQAPFPVDAATIEERTAADFPLPAPQR